MANENVTSRLAGASTLRQFAMSPAQARTTAVSALVPKIRPDVRAIPALPQPAPTPAPAPAAAPAPAPAAPQSAPPAIPAAPVETPFDKLPFPSPGDRIKADDFKAISQSLTMLYDLFVLTSNLFGRPYSEVRLVLGSRGYQLGRVITVFGNEITDLNDTSLDQRKVIQVIPAAPGTPVVMLVLTEAVDTRRFAPNLIGADYRTAAARIQSLLGDVPLQGAPPSAPDLQGLSLSEALKSVSK